MILSAVESPRFSSRGTIVTQSQLNILSGGLTECLVEPRHVRVEYSREPPHQDTAAHPTEDHWEESIQNGETIPHCDQSHSSSHYQRREELS